MASVEHPHLEIVSFGHGPFVVGKPMTYDIQIKNTGDVTYSGLVIVVEKTHYVVRSAAEVPILKPFSRVRVAVDVDVRAGATVDDVVKEMPVSLQDRTGLVMCRLVRVYNSMWWFGKTITEMSTGFPCNILVFGMAGATKSSFIETCINIMEAGTEVKHGRIRIGGSSGHATQELRCHNVGGINLWDTWGLTGKNYDGAQLRAMLQGKLPDGWGMHEQIGDFAQELRLDAAHRKFRRPQACIVFVPYGSLDIETDVAALKVQIEFIRDAGINPILMLSLVDNMEETASSPPVPVSSPQVPSQRQDSAVSPLFRLFFGARKQPPAAQVSEQPPRVDRPTSNSLRKNAMAPPSRLRELMRHVASTFNVPLNMVTYTVNYESETQRDFNIERLCLKNLMMAINAAKAYQMSRDEAESDGLPRREPVWRAKLMARAGAEKGGAARVERMGGITDIPPTQRTGGITDIPPTAPIAGGFGGPAAAMAAGLICRECEDDRAEMMVQPCGHLCVCSTCGPVIEQKRKVCPMCRGNVDRMQKVYY